MKLTIRKLQKLRDSAKEAQWCFSCMYTVLPGSLVLAHSNEQDAGKGMGIKSVDYLGAIVCHECHDMIDGRKGHLSREEAQAMHRAAHRRTLMWWFEMGYIRC